MSCFRFLPLGKNDRHLHFLRERVIIVKRSTSPSSPATTADIGRGGKLFYSFEEVVFASKEVVTETPPVREAFLSSILVASGDQFAVRAIQNDIRRKLRGE